MPDKLSIAKKRRAISLFKTLSFCAAILVSSILIPHTASASVYILQASGSNLMTTNGTHAPVYQYTFTLPASISTTNMNMYWYAGLSTACVGTGVGANVYFSDSNTNFGPVDFGGFTMQYNNNVYIGTTNFPYPASTLWSMYGTQYSVFNSQSSWNGVNGGVTMASGSTFAVSFALQNIGHECQGSDYGPMQTYGDGSLPYIEITTAGETPSPPPVVRTDTRIDSVTPPNSTSGVATSTTFAFGAAGYINENDLPQPTFLNSNTEDTITLSYRINGLTACNGVSLGFLGACSDAVGGTAPSGTYTWTTDLPGPFSFSTTTNIQTIGVYTLTTTITRPQSFLGINLWGSTLISTTTSFTVATSTQFDQLQANVVTALSSLSGVASSTQVIDSLCNPFSGQFSFSVCFGTLFVPSTADIGNSLTNFQNDIFTRVPFGYLTRAIEIFQGTSTIPLPDLSFTFGTSTATPTALQGTTFAFSPWQYFYNGSSTVIKSIKSDTPTPEDAWQIVQPAEQTFLWIILILMIINDLTKIHGHDSGGSHKEKRK